MMISVKPKSPLSFSSLDIRMLTLAFLSFFALLPASAEAQEGERPLVMYGGFLMAGRYDQLPEDFPYTFRLIYQTQASPAGGNLPRKDDAGRYLFTDGGVPEFYRYWFNLHREVRDKEGLARVELAMTKAEAGTRTTLLALGLVLTREDVGILHSVEMDPRTGVPVERFFGHITLCFQYLIMDFQSVTLRSSRPFYIGYDHFFGSTRPTDGEILALIRTLYTGEPGRRSIVAERAKEMMKGLTLWPGNVIALQITDVKILPPAREALGLTTDPAATSSERLLSESYAADLAALLEVPVVPGSRSLVNGSLALAFPDNTVRMFSVPKAFFSVSLEVQAFHRSVKEESKDSTRFLLGAYLHAAIRPQGSERAFWDHQTKYAGPPKWIQKRLIPSWDFSFTFRDLLGLAQVRSIMEMKEDRLFQKEILSPCHAY